MQDVISLTLIAILAASIFAILGTFIQRYTPVIQNLHLPGALLGGLVALVIGPQVLGEGFADFDLPQNIAFLKNGLIPKELIDIWKELPKAFINVVFAGLLLGHALPKMKTVFTKAGPQVVMGHCLAWGQYVTGLALAFFVLVPHLDANPHNAAMIAIGFQGGYGTAIGLTETFQELGFPDGKEIGIGMATLGKLVGLLFGPMLLYYAIRMELVEEHDHDKHIPDKDIPKSEAYDHFRDHKKEQGQMTDVLLAQTAFITIAIGIGWLLLHGLRWAEALITGPEPSVEIMPYVPLFPMAMIGGLALQFFLEKIGREDVLNRRFIARISGAALDIVIMTAVATLALDVLAAHWFTLLVLTVGGVASNLLIFFLLGTRFYKKNAWVHGLSDLGHSTGTTATGLMLTRAADPENKTGAHDTYSYKQPLYEPLLGGGIITALSVPFIHAFGVSNLLVFTSAMLCFWVALGIYLFGFKKRAKLFKPIPDDD